jgi:quinol monooxygenase YgiN
MQSSSLVLITGGILVGWRRRLSFHFIVRFEPLPGKEAAFRDELLRVNESSRAEVGCLNIDVFESLREPFVFAIHSEWADEASHDVLTSHAGGRRWRRIF